uniref:Ribosomal protein L18 n=1 Tax=Amorphochlora amoebiformis TaxID=1561963 RepID=A0A0H5BQZ5_9EUKA|nr:ribosomal protein L18 [Amorphochlora amoebiformis]
MAYNINKTKNLVFKSNKNYFELKNLIKVIYVLQIYIKVLNKTKRVDVLKIILEMIKNLRKTCFTSLKRIQKIVKRKNNNRIYVFVGKIIGPFIFSEKLPLKVCALDFSSNIRTNILKSGVKVFNFKEIANKFELYHPIIIS